MSSPLHILVVEDDPELREELTEALRDEGYAVVATARGDEAVEAATAESFDLLITDVRMPGIDGLEALERVRASQPDVRSLVITGYASEEDWLRAARLGASEYLRKPFPLEDLLDSVRRLGVGIAERKIVAERESALRRTAVWALEAWARAVDPALVGKARLAAMVATELGLSGPLAADVQLAALAYGIHQRADTSLALEGLPAAGALRVIRQLEEGEESSEARVVSLVSRLDDPPSNLDGALAEALQRARARVAAESAAAALYPAYREQGRKERQLLSLARALEESDPGQAEELYRHVSRKAGGRPALEALLGAARVARARGAMEEVRGYAREAWQRSLSMGSLLSAECALEAGLLLARVNPEEGVPLLERTLQLLRPDQAPSGRARAVLALRCFAGRQIGDFETSVRELMRPEHRAELADSLPWLLPSLMEHAAPALLTRIVREFPRELLRVVKSGSLSPKGQQKAVEALREAGPGAQGALRLLMGAGDPSIREAAGKALHHLSPDPGPPLLRIYSLGALEVYRGEDRVPESAWQSQKVRYLLAYLACQPGHHAGEERIIEDFWPGSPEKGRRSVYSASSRLRKALRPDGETDYLLRTAQGLQLNPALPLWHDLTVFCEAIRQGDLEEAAGRVGEALALFRRAVTLYRAPFLEGCYMEWALEVRTRTERAGLAAAHSATRLCLQQGRYAEAVDFGLRALEWDPCFQQVYEMTMEAYLSQGRPEEAARIFEQARRVLRQELGLEPSIELMRLHQRALLSL
ncbi:MAG: response regulator [Armatimonadetes bacterium]|nr:response regulator [Armatimonadota bacterium]